MYIEKFQSGNQSSSTEAINPFLKNGFVKKEPTANDKILENPEENRCYTYTRRLYMYHPEERDKPLVPWTTTWRQEKLTVDIKKAGEHQLFQEQRKGLAPGLMPDKTIKQQEQPN